mmetsp:Transcript_17903/g.26888  ORF Transcript_17903/g.26888 Transcript_17903/m.26888 type:complete len:671 (-) Transcript_17903:377-2389(-)
MQLPKPRLPSGARSRGNDEGIKKSTTASVRGTVLSSLLTTSQARDEFEDTSSLDGSSSGNHSSIVMSSRVVRNYKTYFEVVTRRPGAVSLSVESARLGEPPILIITRVNDEGCLGTTVLDPGGSVVGLALVGISKTPLCAQSPERPKSLRQALDILNAEPKHFPLYLHLCLKEHATYTQQPVRNCLKLRRIVVATNRRPLLQQGADRGCTFANTIIDQDLNPSSGSPSRQYQDYGVVWGLATIAIEEDESLYRVDDQIQTNGDMYNELESNQSPTTTSIKKQVLDSPDAAASAEKGQQQYKIEMYQFIGWEPLRRETCQSILRGRECLVYVHGFNTLLQFAVRSAALYTDNILDADTAISICFCWPSNPPLPKTWAISAVLSVAERNYTAAEQSLQRSVPALLYTASTLAEAGPNRLYWKCHSMGCYLTLSALDRLLQRDDKDIKLSTIFSRIILDAPDAPTWFFVDVLKRATMRDVRFLHLFNPLDEAVEIARQRRGLEFPAPGNGAVLDIAGVQVVDCSLCRASMGRHDYGRVDQGCLEEQRLFIAGLPPEQRRLDVLSQTPCIWQLPYVSASSGTNTSFSRSRSRGGGSATPRKPSSAKSLPPLPTSTLLPQVDTTLLKDGNNDEDTISFSENDQNEADDEKSSFSEKDREVATPPPGAALVQADEN